MGYLSPPDPSLFWEVEKAEQQFCRPFLLHQDYGGGRGKGPNHNDNHYNDHNCNDVNYNNIDCIGLFPAGVLGGRFGSGGPYIVASCT